MNTPEVKQLEELIKGMALPNHRKSIKSTDGVRWLARNLQIKNSDHENFDEAVKLIKQIL